MPRAKRISSRRTAGQPVLEPVHVQISRGRGAPEEHVTDLAAYHHAQAQETETRASTRPPRVGTAPTCSRSRRYERGEDELPARRGALRERRLPDAASEYERTATLSVPRQRREAGYAALLAYTSTKNSSAAASVRVASPRDRQRAEFADTYSCTLRRPGANRRREKLFALGEFGRARDVAERSSRVRPRRCRCSERRGRRGALGVSISQIFAPPRRPTCAGLRSRRRSQRGEITERIACRSTSRESRRAPRASRRCRRALPAVARARRRLGAPTPEYDAGAA